MTNKEIAANFIDSWRRNTLRLEQELQSFSNETNRRPDGFYYLASSEGLVDPATQKLVRHLIDTQTPLGLAELNFLNKLEELVGEVDEGIFLWLSPSYPDRYPCSKAIFYEVLYTWDGQKVLNNTAFLFDLNPSSITSVASEIANSRFSSAEEVRRTPIFLENWQESRKLLESIVRKQLSTKENYGGTTNYTQIYAEMIRQGAPTDELITRMKKSGFLGNFAVSCPPTFSEHTIRAIGEPKFIKACGRCGRAINGYISKGFKCPNCDGVYEGC